jgi:glucose-1-phosphate cytidylyltransferase
MKVAILAGGLGTRLSEETEARPKPMVEIDGRPIIWHIMKSFANQGFNQFVIAAGYKSEQIKKYFADYHMLESNYLRVKTGTGQWHTDAFPENWEVEIVDTGQDTLTGGRVKRLQNYLFTEAHNRDFILTYGDGLSDVEIHKVIRHHRENDFTVTVTAVHPPSRFGEISFDEEGAVTAFDEKPQTDVGWINGGFMVCNQSVLNDLHPDSGSFETEILAKYTPQDMLGAYKHEGFWQCMDTIREKKILEDICKKGTPPWLR